MRITLFAITCLAVMLGAASSAFAWVDDDFDGTTTGSQWTWHDSTPAGSLCGPTGSGKLRIKAKEKSDVWVDIDAYCYLEQPAPTGTNWEVVMKMDNFDPTQTGFKSVYERTGIQVWQDNDHWLAVGMLSDGTAATMGAQGFWQTKPTPTASDPLRYFGADDCFPVSTSPIYLKIQKTTRGYQAGVSADGVNWQVASPRVKNPETADGYFTAEKIRVYQSGGNSANPGLDVPADIDYVRSTTVAAPISVACQSDEFDGTALNSSVWGYDTGCLASRMSVSGGNLNLQAGYGNDLWETWERPTYVYQNAPTNINFAVSVMGGPTDVRSYDLYNEYGIWLWQDQCNWLYIGNQRSNNITNRCEVAYKRNGLFDSYVPDFGTGACPQYLRIEQRNNVYTATYSFDNNVWVPVPAGGITYAAPLRNPEVRLFGKSVTNATNDWYTPKVNAQFNWFHAVDLPTAAQDWALFE